MTNEVRLKQECRESWALYEAETDRRERAESHNAALVQALEECVWFISNTSDGHVDNGKTTTKARAALALAKDNTNHAP